MLVQIISYFRLKLLILKLLILTYIKQDTNKLKEFNNYKDLLINYILSLDIYINIDNNYSNIQFDYVNEIIEKNNYDLIKSQENIENELNKIILNKLEDPNSKVRKNMLFILNKSTESLNLLLDNKGTIRKFKKIKNSFKRYFILFQLAKIHRGINKVVNNTKNKEIPSIPKL